jgi:hypothetical protein
VILPESLRHFARLDGGVDADGNRIAIPEAILTGDQPLTICLLDDFRVMVLA